MCEKKKHPPTSSAAHFQSLFLFFFLFETKTAVVNWPRGGRVAPPAEPLRRKLRGDVDVRSCRQLSMVLKITLFPPLNPRMTSSLGAGEPSCLFDLTWNYSVIRRLPLLDVFLACQPVLTCEWLALPQRPGRRAHLSAPRQKCSALAVGRIGAS